MAPKQAENVSVSELNSFITKFKLLCSAGLNASLQIDSKDGCATVTVCLSVEVGYLPSVTPAGKPKKQKRSPAYYRRQERRKEAKRVSATAVEAVKKVDHVKMKVKSAGAWWELTDENGITCYLNVETDEVIYNLPKGWVKSMAKCRFSTNKN